MLDDPRRRVSLLLAAVLALCELQRRDALGPDCFLGWLPHARSGAAASRAPMQQLAGDGGLLAAPPLAQPPPLLPLEQSSSGGKPVHLAQAARAAAAPPSKAAGSSSSLALAVALAGAAAVAAYRRLQGRDSSAVRRRGGVGMRDYREFWEKTKLITGRPRKGWFPGEYRRGENHGARPEKEPNNRLCLAKIYDALKTFQPYHYPTAPAAKLDYKDVKSAGVCMVDDDGEVETSVEIPEYKRPRLRRYLEQDPGTKKHPLEDGAWQAKMQRERLGLERVASALAAKGSASLEKDIIADREALITLFLFLDRHFRGNITYYQEDNPIDLVKISKCSKSGALVMECLFDQKDLFAGFVNRATWRRYEQSYQGTYEAAWKRACKGDTSTVRMDISGRYTIQGTSAGKHDRFFRLVEYNLGGLEILARVPADLTKDGKNIGLRCKTFSMQGTLTKMRIYLDLLLGGVDMVSLCLHKIGRIHEIHEIGVEALAGENPHVVEATEARLGQLVALLKEVRDAVSADGDGPWSLQLQNGKLLLGKWELPPDVESESEEAKVAVEA